MSRYYEMRVEVKDVATDEETNMISEVFAEEWEEPEDEYFSTKSRTLDLSARNSLYGGESEEDFSERLTHAIWQKLGRFVPVTVTAIYLEDPPCETYSFSEEEFKLFKTKTPSE